MKLFWNALRLIKTRQELFGMKEKARAESSVKVRKEISRIEGKEKKKK